MGKNACSSLFCRQGFNIFYFILFYFFGSGMEGMDADKIGSVLPLMGRGKIHVTV